MFRCLVCDRECADFEFPVNSYHMCYHCHVDMAIVHSTFALTHADLLPYGALVVEVALSPIHVGAIDQGHAVDFAQIAGGATDSEWPSDWSVDEFIDDDAGASAVFYVSEHLAPSSDWSDVELNGGNGESSTMFASTACI